MSIWWAEVVAKTLFYTYFIDASVPMNGGAHIKTIVFIGSYKFGTSKEALMSAKEMGYYVVLFTDKTSNLNFLEVDQFVIMEHLLDEQLVMEEITKLKERGKQVCACISFIDPYVSYAAKLSNHLGLSQVSVESLGLMENKIAIREKLENLSITPFFTIFHPNDSPKEFKEKHKFSFPFILKPPISNGSKDVLLVETTEKFVNALKLVQKKHPNSPLLIEEFIQGTQYLVEVLVYKSVIKFVGLVEQEVKYNGRFIVTGYKYPGLVDADEYSRLYACILSIIEQTGLSNGSCHIEMKLAQGHWKLIEINPRMSGGAMNRIIEEGTGINLVKEILKVYLGEEPILIEQRKKHVYARYLTIGSRGKLLRVTGKELALMHDGVKYVHIKPLEGRILTTPYSMGNRYACIIAVSDTAEQAEASAIVAAKEIKFYLEPF
ncbi:ATP-grasp domain-containing protein [Psychrobacillus soli]|uniref:ATP-grasp domain-containing protein n=1 Tax=Psychrobacillus soli TaxID=1543965 RepID=A0A544TGG2_9BACI|nr:ATP-grasp domain-containing protein [Psychrobacillus soli]TQR16563.1 ATP-grasp domain-containing protein [Psychrobacillus soli]